MSSRRISLAHQQLGLLMLLAILIASLSACGSHGDSKAGGGSSKKGSKSSKVSKAERAYYEKVKNDVVATIGGKDITREHVLTYNALAKVRPDISTRETVKAKSEDLKPIIQDLAITQVAGAEADLTPEARTTEVLQQVQQYKNEFLIRALFQNEILSKVAEPTDKEIRQYYEKNSKDPQFTPPFHFSIRHVIVSNYVPVETKEGDTLEGLAKRISGDVRLTSMILVDNEQKSPRAPDYGSNPAIPKIQPGEFLLVPAGPEQKRENLEKIKQAQRRIKSGEDFGKVAAEVSGDPAKKEVIPDVGLSGKVPLAGLVEAVKKTPVNGISDIFETKHGYNIVQVIKKEGEKARPLEDVKDEILKRLMEEKQQETGKQYMNNLFKMPDLKINYAAFKDPSTPQDAVVVTLGKQTYTNKDVQLPDVGRPEKKMSDEAVLATLQTNRRLQTDLLLYKAKQLGLDKSGSYLGAVDGMINTYKRQLYFNYLRSQEMKKEISPEEAKDYFEKNKDDFALTRAYTFYRLALQVPPVSTTSTLTADELQKKTLVKAAELTQGIKSLDEFKRVISENANDDLSKNKQGFAENVPESQISPVLLKEFQLMKPGALSQPIQIGDNVIVAWLVSTRPARPARFEDYKDNLQSVVKNAKMNKFTDEMNARWLQKANVTIR